MFERMLWRVCRGNVYMRSSEIEAPLSDPIYPDESVYKTAFIIFFQGEQLKMRVRKICEGYVLRILHEEPEQNSLPLLPSFLLSFSCQKDFIFSLRNPSHNISGFRNKKQLKDPLHLSVCHDWWKDFIFIMRIFSLSFFSYTRTDVYIKTYPK